MRHYVQVGERRLCSRRGDHRQLGHFINLPVPSGSSLVPLHVYHFHVMMEGCFHIPDYGTGWFMIGSPGYMSTQFCPCSVPPKVQ
jgi:hypothetical protein